jgi:hypothetical protein
MILHFFVKEGFAFKKRYAPRSNHHHWTEAGAHILRLSEPGKASSSREESSMSAGHRERARKISNLTTRGRKGTSRSQPHVDNSDLQNVRLSVGFNPGRPRGGLTFVPSRHPQQVPTSAAAEAFIRVPLLAPFPSCTPLLGPMPSGAYVVPTLGYSPKWSPLDNHKCTSVRDITHLRKCHSLHL